MKSLIDYGLADEQRKIDLDKCEYIALNDLADQTKVIADVVFYTKDERNKAIIQFNDGTYTVTGAIAVINKLMTVDAMNEDDDAWDLQVKFVERKSKKSGKAYIDMF